MFPKILVPVDESHISERAIPVAARIARATHNPIILTYVIVPMGTSSARPFLFMQESLDIAQRSAQDYLNRLIQSPALSGLTVQPKIYYEHPAYAILETIQDEHADLVVMSSRGQSGFTRWALGSVTQKVARLSQAPVLVLHSEESETVLQLPETGKVRILVGLDGSALAEAAIEPALQLLATLAPPDQRELHLLKLIPEPTVEERRAVAMAHLDIDLTALAIQETRKYLTELIHNKLEKQAEEAKVQIITSITVCADIADGLIQIAEGKSETDKGPFAVIALTTHGRSGVQRWLMGSITERVLYHTKLPTLVVHPEQNKQ